MYENYEFIRIKMQNILQVLLCTIYFSKKNIM